MMIRFWRSRAATKVGTWPRLPTAAKGMISIFCSRAQGGAPVIEPSGTELTWPVCPGFEDTSAIPAEDPMLDSEGGASPSISAAVRMLAMVRYARGIIKKPSKLMSTVIGLVASRLSTLTMRPPPLGRTTHGKPRDQRPVLSLVSSATMVLDFIMI